jgi:hypothetical protein
MDPGQLLTLAILSVAIVYGSRVVLGSVGTAGDVLAQLFVPPNLALGWPRGIQESDAPWGWQAPTPGPDPEEIGGPTDWPGEGLIDLDELTLPIRAGSYVVPVQRVRSH